MSDTSNTEERTELPTRRRLEKAREEGQVVRAPGLSGAVVLLAGMGLFTLSGGSLIASLERAMSSGLNLAPETMRDPAMMFAGAWQVIDPALQLVLPLIAILVVVGVAANLAIGGMGFSGSRLVPDLNRISPIAGLKRLFSRDALFEIGKALAQLAVVGTVAYIMLRGSVMGYVNLARESWPDAARHFASLSSHTMLIVALALAAVVGLEVPYRIWAHRERLMMTRQEVRDEQRELEVSPYTRRRLRALRRRFARSRMMTEVPRADVVITNPEHYAAALRYNEGKMRAPRLVAKGGGLVAQRIREIAVEHDVPLVAAPPLARTIVRFVELEDEIPVGLYKAVAEVLAHVYRIKVARDAGITPPNLPDDGRFDPPDDLKA